MAKKKGNKDWAYLLFTAAMVACCVGLYLAQSPTTAPAQAPLPTPTPLYHSYPAEEAFLENAAAFGLSAQLEPLKGNLPGAAEYRLEREEGKDAYLTLSFREGGVCAFLLRVPLVEDPGGWPKDPTPIEADLYRDRLFAYTLEKEWREGAFQGLCTALDPTGSCTATDIARFYAQMEETARKGTEQAGKAGDVSFGSYLLQEVDGSILCASASRRDG